MNKGLRYLGLAKKAGRVMTGSNTCAIGMERGKVSLLILAGDMAGGSREKIERIAERTGTNRVVWGDSEELSQITGTAGRYVFAVTDEHFAEIILQEINAGTE